MKRTLTLAAAAAIAALWAAPAHAVTQGFTYSGFLLDSAGNPVTTPTLVSFGFFDTESANTAAPNYVEGPMTVAPSSDGFFSAIVGLTVPNAFFHSNVWVTLKVGTEQFMLPRLQLTAAPGALSTNPVAMDTGTSVPLLGTGTALVAGDNYLYGASVTLPAGGWCVASTSLTIANGAAANTSNGPFYRVAIQRAGSDGNDTVYGLYPGPLAAGARASLSRTQTLYVNAGELTQFGCYLGSVPADWVGDVAACVADVHCF